MCFGKKLNQHDEIPSDNNYCGGFALDAVLTDLKIRSDVKPLATYKKIQTVQKEKLDLRPMSISAFFVGNTILNDTAMSLPSSIALVASREGLCVTVYINEELLKKELQKNTESFVETFIAEEKKQLGDHGIIIQDPKGYKDLATAAVNSTASHFIVLVNDAQHWVAVKKEVNGSYTCYDPGTGEVATRETLGEAVSQAKYNANTLIIALSERETQTNCCVIL